MATQNPCEVGGAVAGKTTRDLAAIGRKQPDGLASLKNTFYSGNSGGKQAAPPLPHGPRRAFIQQHTARRDLGQNPAFAGFESVHGSQKARAQRLALYNSGQGVWGVSGRDHHWGSGAGGNLGS